MRSRTLLEMCVCRAGHSHGVARPCVLDARVMIQRDLHLHRVLRQRRAAPILLGQELGAQPLPACLIPVPARLADYVQTRAVCRRVRDGLLVGWEHWPRRRAWHLAWRQRAASQCRHTSRY